MPREIIEEHKNGLTVCLKLLNLMSHKNNLILNLKMFQL